MDRPYVPAAHKGPPHNVAAWALKAKQRPLVVGNAPYTSPPRDCIVIKVIDVVCSVPPSMRMSAAVISLLYPQIGLGKEVSYMLMNGMSVALRRLIRLTGSCRGRLFLGWSV